MIQESLLKERVYKLKLFYNQTGRMPSYSEIAELFGFRSKNAAFKFIEKLIKLNLIQKDSKGKLIPISLANQIKVLGSGRGRVSIVRRRRTA